MCGTNDVDNPYFNSDNLIDTYKKVLDNTKNTNVIISYLPFRYDKPHFNHKIQELNHKIRLLTLHYNHTNYLSFYGFDSSCYTIHGLHHNDKGKYLMCKQLVMHFLNRSSPQTIPVRITDRFSSYKCSMEVPNFYSTNFLCKRH